MKVTIEGKRYDSDKCEIIGTKDCSYNGVYSGTNFLLRASDGKLLYMQTSNGQDLFRQSYFCSVDHIGTPVIDNVDMTDEQEKLAEKYGIISIVE